MSLRFSIECAVTDISLSLLPLSLSPLYSSLPVVIGHAEELSSLLSTSSSSMTMPNKESRSHISPADSVEDGKVNDKYSIFTYFSIHC